MAKLVYLFFICLQFFSSFSDAFNNMVSNLSLQLQQSKTLLNRPRSGSVTPRPDTVMTLHSNPNDEMDGARHTYVEGGEYDDIFSEIEAMGGDPFFLDDDESEMKMAKKESVVVPEKLDSAASIFKAVERSVTDGKGPSPRKKDNDPIESKSSDWEWDGTVDEDAHMGWD